MELLSVIFSTALIAVVFKCLFSAVFGPKLPPSPWKLPLIGHLHHLATGIPKQSFLAISRKYGPIVFLRLGFQPAVVVSTPELAREVLKNQDSAFASRPFIIYAKYVSYNFSGIVATPLNEHWKNMRKLCATELFTTRSIDSYLSVRMDEMSRVLSSLVETHRRGETVDVRKLLTGMTHNVMTRILISKRYFSYDKHEEGEVDPDANLFKDVSDEVVQEFLLFHISEFVPPYLRWIDWEIPRMKLNQAKLDKFLEKVLSERRSDRRDRKLKDFLDIMIEYFQGRNDETIKSLIMELIVAGTGTAAITSEWILMELLQNPKAMERVQEEIMNVVGHNPVVEETEFHKLSYLNAVIKEGLRLHPPAPLLAPHMTIMPCKLAGYDIPSGCSTFVNVYAITTDKTVWGEDALEFRPERFLESSIDVKGQDFELLPFGSGRRICPGMVLGLKTVQLLVSNLVHGFEWNFVPGRKYDMEEANASVVCLKTPLEAVVSPRFAIEI